jgi:hypothetical protein
MSRSPLDSPGDPCAGPRKLAAIEEEQEKLAYRKRHFEEVGGISYKRGDFQKGDPIKQARGASARGSWSWA